MNTWTLNLHVQKMKTRTPCGELVWRSNMRRCRFEDGSRYCPSTCKWYFRFYQTSKSFQECWRIWLEKFKTRFSFYEHFFSFHHKVVKKKGIINSCGKGREKKIANLQKAWGRKRRQGQGWRKTNVLWEIGYYTCSLPPPLLLGLRVRERCPQTTIGIYQALLTVCTGWPDQRVESYSMWTQRQKRFNFNIRVQEPI